MPDSVYELRRYTLHPGRRDDLIELFDREFVETQDAVGAHVVAQYRDLRDADQFVWIRSFADMPARREALTAFYGGPVWKQHAAAANATMIDSDNVLLLRAVVAPAVEPGSRGRSGKPPVAALLFECDRAATDRDLDRLANQVAASLQGVGLPAVALFATLTEVNDFPARPVRDARGVVAVVQHSDRERQAGAIDALRGTDWGARRPDLVHLAPTERSNALVQHGASSTESAPTVSHHGVMGERDRPSHSEADVRRCSPTPPARW